MKVVFSSLPAQEVQIENRRGITPSQAECDISVQKLLGFETFANFGRVSVGKFGKKNTKNLVWDKKSQFSFREIRSLQNPSLIRKIWSQKNRLCFDLRKFGLGKKSWFRFCSKFWSRHSVLPSDDVINEQSFDMRAL